MKLGSGKPLPRGSDGRPIYSDGQIALGSCLVGLKRHRFDENKKDYLLDLLTRFDLVPDHVLENVAAEIIDMIERGLRQQPRYEALAAMVRAAWQMDKTLAALRDRRYAPRQHHIEGCMGGSQMLSQVDAAPPPHKVERRAELERKARAVLVKRAEGELVRRKKLPNRHPSRRDAE